MKILFVAPECTPFAKAGGLGDVVGALPKALALLGHDVRVLLPKYGVIDSSGFQRYEGMMAVPLGIGPAWCGLLEGRLPGSRVPIYLLEHDAVFAGDDLYGGGGERTLWGGVRFALLSRGAFELCRSLGWYPDVLHVHDWPTAWVPVMLNELETESPWDKVVSVLTIHNMAHQPRFSPAVLAHVGLGHNVFRPDGLEDHGEVNVFKGGLFHATMLTTVSPRYALEIRTRSGGFGLAQVVEYRGADLVGILNGIDEVVWDPSSDPYLPARFSSSNLTGKAVCKAALETRMGLDKETGPIIGMVSRLSPQKGLDLVASGTERILATGARLVFLGSGEPGLQEHFQWLSQQHPGRVSAVIGYDEGLAHLIEAGADLFLMPSRFEPCGLNQMYSQRYGTLPIVHATGGLDDTVEQCDPVQRSGTGFKMYDLSEDAVVSTVRWAVDVFRNDPELVRVMQTNGMRKRMGWDRSAVGYTSVYHWALERKGIFL